VVFAWGTLAFNVLVILWGNVVRATNSGNGCGNHWPFCSGQIVPTLTNVHTQIEFWHRASVGLGFFAIIGLLIWTRLSTAPWHMARKTATLAVVFAVLEAFLGAMLVKLGYTGQDHSVGRVILLSIHLTNTMMMLGAMAMTANLLAQNQDKAKLAIKRNEVILLLVGMLATLVVCVSGSLAALGDTLFPMPTLAMAVQKDFAASSPWLLRLRWTHPALAMIATIFIFWIAIRALINTGTIKIARRNRIISGMLIGLIGYQFSIGLLDVVLLAPVPLQVLHLLGADMLWIALVLLVAGTAFPPTEAIE